jgi:hypothetical protein
MSDFTATLVGWLKQHPEYCTDLHKILSRGDGDGFHAQIHSIVANNHPDSVMLKDKANYNTLDWLSVIRWTFAISHELQRQKLTATKWEI